MNDIYIIQSLLVHKAKFTETLNTISGKYKLRDARRKLEKKLHERRRKEEENQKCLINKLTLSPAFGRAKGIELERFQNWL